MIVVLVLKWAAIFRALGGGLAAETGRHERQDTGSPVHRGATNAYVYFTLICESVDEHELPHYGFTTTQIK